MQHINEKRNSVNQNTHFAFIDLEKAYDSIARCKLWEAVGKLKINPAIT
jgi:hypothetical protein